MRDVAFVFFLSAVLCVALGMALGIWMGLAQDFTMTPVHAHLNLLGWATLALFAIYYRLTPAAGRGRLAVVHAALALPGVVLMTGGLAWEFMGGPIAPVIVGSLLSAASMLVFLATVLRHGFGPARPEARGADREVWLGATS